MPETSLDVYDQLSSRLENAGPQAALEHLVEHLRQEKRLHELFDARLLESRLRLGLPAISTTSLEDIPEPQRSKVEEAYVAACREVGRLFLEEGKLREAWMYLRPAGDKAVLADALGAMQPGESQLEECIEVAVHQGVAPQHGIRWILNNYGTCNAISTTEGGIYNWNVAERRAVIATLVRHVHQELTDNLRRDIARQEGQPPTEATVAALVADRDWLFANDNYHLDTSHLNATVRLARLLVDRDVLTLAADLTEYGRRLSRMYRYAGDEPFVDAYPASGLFFQAQLDQGVEEALAYFREKAEQLSVEEHGAGPGEVYVTLLSRLGRTREALEASIEFLPPGAATTGLAPSLMELANSAHAMERLQEVCRQRDDLLGFATGLLAAKKA